MSSLYFISFSDLFTVSKCYYTRQSAYTCLPLTPSHVLTFPRAFSVGLEATFSSHSKMKTRSAILEDMPNQGSLLPSDALWR